MLPAWALTGEQEAKLLASDGQADDNFGYSVALDGDTALVGASHDDPQGQDSGSAYVFIRTGGVWTQQAKLVPGDGVYLDYFGMSVSLDGDTALIGATGDDDNGTDSGSAYVYTRTGDVWTREAKLLPDDGVARQRFSSHAVSLDGDTALIGAYGDDDNGWQSGSAYVFERTGGAWVQHAKLLPDDGDFQDQFGYSVALDGDTMVVGTRNGGDSWYGAAYVFTREGGVWTQRAKLLPDDGVISNKFGSSVSLEGDTVLIGAPGDIDNGGHSGSAYVFIRTGGVWTQQAKLVPGDGAADDEFGWPLFLDGDTALIGVHGDDDNGPESGSAYVFTRTGGVWTQRGKVLPDDGDNGDFFGYSVALDGDTALIGARRDDDLGYSSGAAYVFRLIAYCGDGGLDPGEECDDGNNVDGDGCAADCTIEQDVPATTYGGMAVMALLLLIASTISLLRRRAAE
jgi:cysteine-rich repeat protein